MIMKLTGHNYVSVIAGIVYIMHVIMTIKLTVT